MNGKKQSILIEDVRNTDPRTGIESVSNRQFVVWTDAGMKDKIKAVEGVVAVYTNQPYDTQYYIYTDPRYDLEYIKREVEAVVLCEIE